MHRPILKTKLHIPPSRTNLVVRPQLIQRLNQGLHRKMTLISAPAGFGKTTLVSRWATQCQLPVVWISLDRRDNDPISFLIYFITTIKTIEADFGEAILSALQTPQPPSTESILTTILNEIAELTDSFILVLDDYHSIDDENVDSVLTFILENIPKQLHLVIVTREDPKLPLARLRSRDNLTELRTADLRFTLSETSRFLNQVMALIVSDEDIITLNDRTEGWVAGLQLAAISMQGLNDSTAFIKSFAGSHTFVMDYLIQEVQNRQSANVNSFLLHTCILDRLCGSLCDAVLQDSSISGQAMLEYIEQKNLFIVPLDNERCWYRYHHLFSDSLRQQLQQAGSLSGAEAMDVNELHRRASQWYEENDLVIEAFYHATLAHDIENAERLIASEEMPLHNSSVAGSVLKWLESLPLKVLQQNPSLWIKQASLLLLSGQTSCVEKKLQSAETALKSMEIKAETRNMVGRIAAVRSMLALTQYQLDSVIAQSMSALEYLSQDELVHRNTAVLALANAYELLGERTAANRAYTKSLSLSQQSGNIFYTILASIGRATILELENQLHLAAEYYQRVLDLFGDYPLPYASDAYLGLARIFYQWNDLGNALKYGEKSLQLAKQYENHLDRYIICEIFLVRLKLAQRDIEGAEVLLNRISQIVQHNNFAHRISEVVEIQIILLLHRGNIEKAADLATTYEDPVSQARVHLAKKDASTALKLLEIEYCQMEEKGWSNERLKIMVLQSVALYACGEKDRAMKKTFDALMLAEPGGFIRLFVDEGDLVAELLKGAVKHGVMQDYAKKLLTAFRAEFHKSRARGYHLVEPLSQRELEILMLIAQGLSNREIGDRLFLALDTVKGHNRNIFAKLQVKRRTEAVARARDLGLLL